MKLLYVILGFEQSNKTGWNESWIKHISLGDCVHHLRGFEEQQFPEMYNYVPYKYSQFIRTYKWFDRFDWIIFCDDDTFLFTNRLGELLKQYDSEESIIIGRMGVYHGWEHASGGAGFAVSSQVILKVKNYLLTKEFEYFINSDTSLCMWAKKVDNDVKFINNDLFNCQHPDHESTQEADMNTAISFHYCSKEHFELLGKYLKDSL